MSWLWSIPIALAVLLVVGAALCVAAPLDVWLHIERFESIGLNGRLRWGWGALALDFGWSPGDFRYRLRLFGREVPRRPIDAVVRWMREWFGRRERKREPFDWQALLTRERVAAELRAMRAGARRFEDPEDAGRLGVDTIDLAIDLLASVGLRARVRMRVSLEEPFALGVLWAAGAVTASMLPEGSFYLEPAFNGELDDSIQGEAEVRGRIKPVPLGWLGLRFVFFTESGRRCLRAAWSWWWYPREAAKAVAQRHAPGGPAAA